MLDFEASGKPEYPELENSYVQSRDQTNPKPRPTSDAGPGT